MKLTRKQKYAFRIVLDLARQNMLDERYTEDSAELAKDLIRQTKAFNTVEETLKTMGMRP